MKIKIVNCRNVFSQDMNPFSGLKAIESICQKWMKISDFMKKIKLIESHLTKDFDKFAH